MDNTDIRIVRFMVRDELWAAKALIPIIEQERTENTHMIRVNLRAAVIDVLDGNGEWIERLDDTDQISSMTVDLAGRMFKGDNKFVQQFFEDIYNTDNPESEAYKKAQRAREKDAVEATYQYSPFNPDGTRKE